MWSSKEVVSIYFGTDSGSERALVGTERIETTTLNAEPTVPHLPQMVIAFPQGRCGETSSFIGVGGASKRHVGSAFNRGADAKGRDRTHTANSQCTEATRFNFGEDVGLCTAARMYPFQFWWWAHSLMYRGRACGRTLHEFPVNWQGVLL